MSKVMGFQEPKLHLKLTLGNLLCYAWNDQCKRNLIHPPHLVDTDLDDVLKALLNYIFKLTFNKSITI